MYCRNPFHTPPNRTEIKSVTYLMQKTLAVQTVLHPFSSRSAVHSPIFLTTHQHPIDNNNCYIPLSSVNENDSSYLVGLFMIINRKSFENCINWVGMSFSGTQNDTLGSSVGLS